LLAQKTLAEKQAKDLQLNQQQKEAAEKKALVAQVKQLAWAVRRWPKPG
jgi:uncharacterized protein YaiL (DUF2058 family)